MTVRVKPSDQRLLRDLADREAVRDVVLRYARAVDDRDLAAVAACFTSDAEYEGALAQGRIADALASLERSLRRYVTTFHFVGNQLVELRGDFARCDSYAIAYHRGGPSEGVAELTVAVRYVDDLSRSGESWRIHRRVARTVWTRRDPPAAAT